MNVYFLACWSLLKSLHFLRNLTGYARKIIDLRVFLLLYLKCLKGIMQTRFHHFLKKYSRNFCQDFVKDTVVKPHSWKWLKTGKLPLIMGILLDQLQLISAKLSTVCPTGYSWPNSMHMASNGLHVKYYAAIYIIATTEWKCVTWKVIG